MRRHGKSLFRNPAPARAGHSGRAPKTRGSRSGGRPPRVRELSVAAATGVVVVVLAWLATPGLFGVGGDAEQRRVIAATVTAPASCTAPDAAETVRFTIAGQQRTGKLTACGHDRDERVDIAVPANSDGGPIEVRSATGSAGYNALHVPLGLIMLTLSCLAGGVYMFLMIRGPRWSPTATR